MNDSMSDALQLLSIYIGLVNVYENRDQSAHNDVSAANDKQAAYMLAEISRKFDEQNEMLRNILEAVRK